MFLAAALVLAFAGPTHAQTAADEAALRRLPVTFGEAWAKHDGHQLAQIMAEDVDFVTVGAAWFHGRKDFETYHTRLLAERFKGSSNTPLETRVRFLRPDLAAVRWSWRIEGDKNPDGSLRPPRYGLMTMIAEKRKGVWQVIAAQNTNGHLEPSPEGADIVSPIAIPLPPAKP